MIYRTGPGSETTAGTRKVNFPFKFLLKTIDFSDGPWIWDHVETMLDRKKNIEKEGIPIENPGRAEKKLDKKLDKRSLKKQES